MFHGLLWSFSTAVDIGVEVLLYHNGCMNAIVFLTKKKSKESIIEIVSLDLFMDS